MHLEARRMSIKKLFAAVTALVIAGTLSISPAAAAVAPQMSIGAMQQTTCVIQDVGNMYCWGQNNLGQLGNGNVDPHTNPVQEATGSTDWRFLFDSSGQHMCAIKNNGTLWCWGNNADGQLGLGDTTNRSTPTQVGTETTWRSGAAGFASTCAVKAAAGGNTLWCWGSNGSGQMGNGTSGAAVLAPVQADLTNWVSVSIGGEHVCGIQTTGTLWCWGGNSEGQLGIGSTDAKLIPTQVAGSWNSVETSTDGGGLYSCGIKLDQTLWCWGNGDRRGLGAGVPQNSAPLQVGTTTWSSIGAGAWTACGIQAADASLWCWGDGWLGNLGSGIANDENDSAAPTAPVTGGAAWAAVARGRDHACAVRTNSTVWCWGENSQNQLSGGSDDLVHSTPIELDLIAGGFALPSTDRDGINFNWALLLLAGALAAAGVGLRLRKGSLAK